MRSVFIVETPLQMLNAIEARHSLDLGECALILILSEPFPEKAFRPLLTFGHWTQVDYVRLKHRIAPMNVRWLGNSLGKRLNEYVKESKQLAKRLRFDRLSTDLGEVENLVLGNLLAGYMQHFANRIRAKRIYLLDDGTDTIRVNALRQSADLPPTPVPLPLLRRLKNRLRTALLDWDMRQKDSVTFFTSYDLDTKPQDKVIRNSYSFWRQRLNSAAGRDAIFFLGQPLVEDGYLAPETYLRSLAEVARFYRGQNFVYLTHRREAKANLDSIREMGVPVVSFELPIEVQMLTGDTPKELSSFFSSALDNSRIIFGGGLKVTAFRIGQSSFHPGHEFVEEIYGYFSTHSGRDFRIIDLQ